MTLLKEIKDTKKWKDILYLQIGRLNTVKKSLLPNGIYRFSAIPITIPMAFFTEIDQKFSNMYETPKDSTLPKQFRGGKNLNSSYTLISTYTTSLANWLEHHPIYPKVLGSILARACMAGNQPMFLFNINVFCLSLSLPHPFSLSLKKINKHIFW